ncbi:MAG: baseplate hub + tail lysozyme [uncultured marine phage]|uniref:Baseplate hub + tail lysozyme n=1 Tax=uncultured marine phage TaxID=707152 RepID=A0A8D9FRP2_9VIRU|nr:MAG: baseplate hub + tail lysozyme [uncultured marine phage]
MEKDLSNKVFVGKVEDNEDPKKLGRCRIRVLNVYDDAIPVEAIPWASPHKDLNGNSFILPEVGKIVTITFDHGKYYMPIYHYAQHYNVNLEKKLTSLSGESYTSMRSLVFDHKTQIFSNDTDGLMMDYKFSQINIKDGSIDLNLKNNSGKVSIGTNNATQEAILGTNFLAWFDEFVDNLLGSSGGPYLGNYGAPVIANPAFINVLIKYKAQKDPKFLSDNVYFNDNGYVNKVDRIAESQIGDDWKSTIEENELVVKEGTPPFKPDDASPEWTPDGTLTPPSDGATPATILSDDEINNQPPTKEVNPDVEVLIALMKDKGYIIYERPYEVNTVGVRYQYPGQEYSNRFMDRLYVLYKDNKDNWIIKYWMITTIPGLYASSKKAPLLLKDDVGKSRGGLGILKPAQYIDVYYMGYHRKKVREQRAMKTTSKSKQLAYRDQNYGSSKITYSNEDPKNAKGGYNFAMYIHRAYPGGTRVNNWSEGCQTFGDKNALNEYFDICETHKKKWGNKFTYTLVTSRDVEDMETKLKQIERRNQKNGGNT